MIDHENRLELVFKGIDLDNDSINLFIFNIYIFNCLLIVLYLDKIGHDELIGYFKKLGVEITQSEAKNLVEK